ncbi:hypothetical protein H2204_000178 [Knufia peltigerae]|uniref:Xylanolytic transcriptional activator regulatory domain-containing protein n=1 Tax=Knufia peltigerae TaxID=1002370 RepID=A0AA38YFE3_9EURO|nr:hypothetical protein H2204_000178 [Knufia peltigerae]
MSARASTLPQGPSNLEGIWTSISGKRRGTFTDVRPSILLHLQKQVSDKELLLRQCGLPDPETTSTLDASRSEHTLGVKRPRQSPLGSRMSAPWKFSRWAEKSFYSSFSNAPTSTTADFPAETLMSTLTQPQQQSQVSDAAGDPSNGLEFPIDDPRSVRPLRDLKAIPVHVANRLFGEYVNRILLIYPAFRPDELWSLFDVVLAEPREATEADDFALYIVTMVLAISVMSNKSYSPPKAYSTSLKLYRYALERQHNFGTSSIQNIQSLVLLIQYCYLMPSAGNPGLLSSAVMRMALDLKLHLDDHDENEDHSAGSNITGRSFTATSRRLLFWTVYVLDRSVSFTLHQRLGIAEQFIGVQAPGCEDCLQTPNNEVQQPQPSDRITSPGRIAIEFVRVVRLRQLQSEIFQVRFMGHKSSRAITEDEWVGLIEKRAMDWLHQLKNTGRHDGESQDALAGDAEGDEYEPGWGLVGYYQALLLLYRPCPVEPEPSEVKLVKCFEAALKLGATTFDYLKKGRLLLPWHGTNQCMQAALVLLFAIKRARRRLVEEKGTAEILQSITLFTTLFAFLSQSWSEAVKFGALYEKLQGEIVRELLRPWDRLPAQSSSLSRPASLRLETLITPQRTSEYHILPSSEEFPRTQEPPGAVGPVRHRHEDSTEMPLIEVSTPRRVEDRTNSGNSDMPNGQWSGAKSPAAASFDYGSHPLQSNSGVSNAFPIPKSYQGFQHGAGHPRGPSNPRSTMSRSTIENWTSSHSITSDPNFTHAAQVPHEPNHHHRSTTSIWSSASEILLAVPAGLGSAYQALPPGDYETEVRHGNGMHALAQREPSSDGSTMRYVRPEDSERTFDNAFGNELPCVGNVTPRLETSPGPEGRLTGDDGPIPFAPTVASSGSVNIFDWTNAFIAGASESPQDLLEGELGEYSSMWLL